MFRTKNCAAILQTGYLGWSTINSGTENRSILVSDQSPVLTIPIPNPAANADAPAHGARHRFPIGLKPTLVFSILGLGLLSKVGAFSISHDPMPKSFVREVNDLGISVDHMKASLRSFGHY